MIERKKDSSGPGQDRTVKTDSKTLYFTYLGIGLPTNWTENTGLPSLTLLSLPLPSFSSPSFLIPLFSLPSVPLEVGPLNPARGLGEHCKLSSGVWGPAKSNLMHFSFKIWHPVATILMIFLRINWPIFNLEAKTLRSCIHLPHYFNTICPRPKNWTFGIPGRPRPGCGTMRPKYGTSREIRDGWQPYLGRSPHWTDFHQNLHSSCRIRLNHMCVCELLNWNFQGLRFFRGSNFLFSYWFLHGPYNSAALLRCLWYGMTSSSECISRSWTALTNRRTVCWAFGTTSWTRASLTIIDEWRKHLRACLRAKGGHSSNCCKLDNSIVHRTVWLSLIKNDVCNLSQIWTLTFRR